MINPTIEAIATMGQQDPVIRKMIAAVLDTEGATSLKHLADMDPDALEELRSDCAMLVTQLGSDEF